MKKILFISLLVFIAFSAEANDSIPGPVQAKVERVVDGDTVVVRARVWLDQEVVTHVRLRGLDTPEMHGKCADERQMAQDAKQFLEDHIGGQTITLSDVSFDKYGGRVLANAKTEDGRVVSEWVIAEGLGRSYGGHKRGSWCEQAALNQ